MRQVSLARRLLLVTVTGGIVVAAVAYLLSVALVRDVAREQAREQLVRAVETFAETPGLAVRLRQREAATVGPDDRQYSLVQADGSVTGPAADLVTEAQVASLLSTGALSTTRSVAGQDVLVEGRVTRRGLAAVASQPVRAVDEATTALLRRLLVALLIGLAAAGSLGLVLSRTLSRSVADAAGAARRLAAGERGVEVSTSSVSEIADMSRAISTLDRALTASEGRQREFLLSVSHEIRTPLTALRGYAEALADGAIGPDDVRATGRTLVAETTRLDRFVGDLLALARLESDDFSIRPVRVSVTTLLTDLAAAWQATCDREGIELRIESGPDTIEADPMRLRQLLDGLVENGVRATPAGGVVVVRSTATDSGVVIEVEDAGPGLTDDDLASTFERGVLHARYREVRAVGTGLGLSIAHRLASRMGMSLGVATAPGGGAVLRLAISSRR